MEIPQIQGRDFNDEDVPGHPEEVIVNDSLAKTYFANSPAVGQHVRLSPQGPWITIVGVVGDVRNSGPETAIAPQVYTCLWQSDSISAPANGAYLVVRSVLPKDAVVMSIRLAVKSLDRDLAIADMHTMSELATEVTARRRFQTMLLSVFSVIAMLMAVVGIYGLLAFSVRQRTGEIGIRMALGATRTGVVRLVLGEGLALLAAGLAIGLVAALSLTRLLSRFLYDVPPIDPLTYAIVPFLLLIGTLAASLIPSLRAASIEPMSALRHE
jgi:putative ABC transport system permease protein